MKITSIADAPAVPNPAGLDAKRLYDMPEAQVIHIRLSPGQVVAKHISPVNAAFFVLEGTGKIEIGEETSEVTAGMTIESPASLTRGIANTGAGNLSFLIIRAPRPAL